MRILALVFLLTALSSPALGADSKYPPGYQGALDPDDAKALGYEWFRIGKAEVIDGDTIRFEGVRMRLYGIDAPEIKQSCYLPGGVPWGCGIAAKVRLEQLIAGQQVRCYGMGEEKFGRPLVNCQNSEFKNLSFQMANEGLAVFYRDKDRKSPALLKSIAGYERIAKGNGAGIWSGTFEAPADYRKSKPRA